MRTAGLFFLGLFSTNVFAAVFDEMQVSGHCNHSNTQVIQNGNALSVVFDDLGADMPQGAEGDGRNVRKNCHFRIRLNAPRDQYLAGLRQVYSGGVIKSKGAVGALEFSYNLGPRVAAPALVWKQGVEITPDSPDSLFTRVVDEAVAQPRGCSAQTTQYMVRISFSASRRNLQEYFVGGLDSYDAEFASKLDLVPTWKPCPRDR